MILIRAVLLERGDHFGKGPCRCVLFGEKRRPRRPTHLDGRVGPVTTKLAFAGPCAGKAVDDCARAGEKDRVGHPTRHKKRSLSDFVAPEGLFDAESRGPAPCVLQHHEHPSRNEGIVDKDDDMGQILHGSASTTQAPTIPQRLHAMRVQQVDYVSWLLVDGEPGGTRTRDPMIKSQFRAAFARFCEN